MDSDRQKKVEEIQEEINRCETSLITIADRPQYLCKTCGKCCKSITTYYTYDELKQLTAEGEPEARVFIEIFKSFPSIEEARKIVPEQIDQIINVLTKDGQDIDKVTFYYCPHIQDDGRCGIYETRPECCRRAPSNGWTVMPPGCGFEGWQFEQREKQKQTIRSMKEHLYAMEVLSTDGKIPGRDMTVEEFRKIVEKRIKPWERYGSMFW